MRRLYDAAGCERACLLWGADRGRRPDDKGTRQLWPLSQLPSRRRWARSSHNSSHKSSSDSAGSSHGASTLSMPISSLDCLS